MKGKRGAVGRMAIGLAAAATLAVAATGCGTGSSAPPGGQTGASASSSASAIPSVSQPQSPAPRPDQSQPGSVSRADVDHIRADLTEVVGDIRSWERYVGYARQATDAQTLASYVSQMRVVLDDEGSRLADLQHNHGPMIEAAGGATVLSQLVDNWYENNQSLASLENTLTSVTSSTAVSTLPPPSGYADYSDYWNRVYEEASQDYQKAFDAHWGDMSYYEYGD